MSKQNSVILVVEDEPGIAELLRYTLVAAGFSIRIAETAEAAREALADAMPRAVLLDWMLPDESGIALLNEWRANARTSALPIIMLTARGLEEDKIKGFDAGADDYLTKPFSPRELVARVNALLRRQPLPKADDKQLVGAIELDEERHRVSVEGVPVDVGPVEFKLLRLLMTHPGRVFSRAQLLDKVWGDHVCIEERTVDVHVMRLRKSLGSSGDCIKTIRSVGYTLQTGAETSD